MTQLIQYKVNKGYGGGSYNVSFASLPAIGHQIVILVSGQTNTSTPVAFQITDNQSGNTYSVVAVASAGGVNRTSQIAWCSSIASSSGTFTISVTAGTGQFLDDITIMEWSGLIALDQTATTSVYQTAKTSLTLTSTANTAQTDVVFAAYTSSYDSATAIGLTNPSGYINLDLNDPGNVGNACCHSYAIDQVANTTDAATWTWTTSANTGAAALASFKAAPVLSAAATDSTTTTAALTTAIKLASAISDSTTATGIMGIYIYANAGDTTTSAASLTTGVKLTASASDATTTASALTNWTTVTLAAPLYTGVGSILDPNAGWSAGVPSAGTVVYYDNTYMTILTSGEITCTSNSFSALCQWNNAGTWSQLAVNVVPTIAAYAVDSTSSTAALTSSWVSVTLLPDTIGIFGGGALVGSGVAGIIPAQLYKGTGSIFDSSIITWQSQAPVAGSTVYYDPTNITVDATGRITRITQTAFTVPFRWGKGGINNTGAANFV